MPGIVLIVPLLIGGLMLASCGESAQVRRPPVPDEVSPEVEQQIDTRLTFAELHAAPDTYVGRLVKLGGIVLGAKRTKDQTELEILELPMDEAGLPTTDRLRSEGRFLAVRETFLASATVPAGTPVTVTGVAAGATTRPLDESEYRYPIVVITHLIDWNEAMRRGTGETKWIVVAKDYLSPEIQTVYFDPDRINRNGNLVTLWQLTDYKMMQGTGAVINPYAFGRLYRYQLAPHGFFSTTSQKQIDCTGKRVRFLAFTEFSHHMGTGRRNDGYVDQDRWLAVEPETVNQALWELVCATPPP
jgi:starvation-inducible outer membrane lipoprotein